MAFSEYMNFTIYKKFWPMKLGQNFVKYFVHFLGNGVSRQIPFEMYWPLNLNTSHIFKELLTLKNFNKYRWPTNCSKNVSHKSSWLQLFSLLWYDALRLPAIHLFVTSKNEFSNSCIQMLQNIFKKIRLKMFFFK